MVPAVWIGALIVVAGALAAFMIRRRPQALAAQLVSELDVAG
jgi:hypothetical protein